MNLTQELIQYCNDILEGKILACQKHKWACQRFLNDLDRQNTDNFPYVFNEDKANRFLDWMHLFKHTKGPLQGQLIEPHIIQKFNFENIFGWINVKTGYRRFRKSYWQVGRKNAKSQSEACVGTYETFADSESASEVYCAATKTKQSKIVWNEARLQTKRCDFLKGKYKIANGMIMHLKSDSYMTYLSKEDGKTGDGFNPQCGIIDEYHLHPTTEMYDVLNSGMGARTQPLMMIITTAGYELNHPCYRVEYKYVSNILNPDSPVENDEYFVMINELDKDKDGNITDDIKDEKVWIKANPIVAENEVGLNYLRGELKAALAEPEKMKTFLTKNMNVWIDKRASGYMEMDKWRAGGVENYDLNNLMNMECIAGLDLSAKNDLTSISFDFKIDNDKYVVLSHSFMPKDRLHEKMIKDKMPYDLWSKDNKWITLTPGSVVDYSYIKKYIEEMYQKYKWRYREIVYDPWNATQFAIMMENAGYTMAEMRQGIRSLSEGTKNFRDSVYAGNVIHDNNPVLTWALGNAVTKPDANENIMLDKEKSTFRIDPAAALMNAHSRMIIVNPDKGTSVYEKRGMRSLL
mgnify:CR=1 FL=1